MRILQELKSNLNLDDDGDFFICWEAKPLQLIEQAQKQHSALLEALEELTAFICDEPDRESLEPLIKARRVIAQNRKEEGRQ